MSAARCCSKTCVRRSVFRPCLCERKTMSMSSKPSTAHRRPSSRSPCRRQTARAKTRHTAGAARRSRPRASVHLRACCRPDRGHRRRAHRLRRRRSGSAHHPRSATAQTAAHAKKSSSPRRRANRRSIFRSRRGRKRSRSAISRSSAGKPMPPPTVKQFCLPGS